MKYAKIVLMLSGIVGGVFLGAPARAQGAYMGVDAVILVNKLSYSNGDETYGTGHLRLKGGYRFTEMFGIEAQVLSSNSNTQNDPFGTPFKMTTGPIAGVYGRIDVPLGESAGLYGLLGAASVSTEYQQTRPVGPVDKDKQTSLSFGFGLNVRFTEQLKGSIDLMYYKVGSATYPSYFTGAGQKPDQVIGGFGAGLTYSF